MSWITSAALLKALLLLSCVALQLVECQRDVPTYIKSNPKFSKFSALLNKSVLAKKNLKPNIGVTLFVPNDAALPAAVYSELNKLSSADLDYYIVAYHIVSEVVAWPALSTGTKLPTLRYEAPDRFALYADKESSPGDTVIRGLYSAAKVVKEGVKVGKSIVYEIDTVLRIRPASKPKYRTIKDAAKALKLNVWLASVAAYRPQESGSLPPIAALVSDPKVSATAFAISDKAFKAYTTREKCPARFKFPGSDKTAHSLVNVTLPAPSLYHGQLIYTMNRFDIDTILGPPQELKVVYVKGKPTIWSQPDRKSRAPFFSANIVQSVLTESGVLHVVDNLVVPYSEAETNCY